jgi:hypothetical protein
MSPRQMVALAVRLFVIWTAISFLTRLPGNAAFLRRGLEDASGLAWLIAGVVLVFAICLVLWFFPLTIAGKLLPGSGIPPAEPATVDQWFSVGCALIGIWALASSLPAIFLFYLPLLHYAGATEGRFSWDLLASLNFARIIGEALLGLYLLFGARGIRRVVRWARTAGAD